MPFEVEYVGAHRLVRFHAVTMIDTPAGGTMIDRRIDTLAMGIDSLANKDVRATFEKFILKYGAADEGMIALDSLKEEAIRKLIEDKLRPLAIIQEAALVRMIKVMGWDG
jgi:hypothetical protein